MKRNLHIIDIIIRVLIGLSCVYIGFIDKGLIANQVAGILVGIFGIVNLIAASMRHCPIYALVGLSTYRDNE